jgi:hypothetical protein
MRTHIRGPQGIRHNDQCTPTKSSFESTRQSPFRPAQMLPKLDVSFLIWSNETEYIVPSKEPMEPSEEMTGALIKTPSDVPICLALYRRHNQANYWTRFFVRVSEWDSVPFLPSLTEQVQLKPPHTQKVVRRNRRNRHGNRRLLERSCRWFERTCQ